MINTSFTTKPLIGPGTFPFTGGGSNPTGTCGPVDSFSPGQPAPDFAGQARKLVELSRDLNAKGGANMAANAAITAQLQMLEKQQELYHQAQAQGKLTCPPPKADGPLDPKIAQEQMHNQNRVLNKLVNEGPQAAIMQQGLIMQELGKAGGEKPLTYCSALAQQQKFNRLINARQMGDVGGQMSAGTDIINSMIADKY